MIFEIKRLLYIVFLLILGCSGRRNDGVASNEINFAIDHSLLSEPLSDSTLQISFSPPRNWTRLSDDVLHLAEREALMRSIGDSSVSRNQFLAKYGFIDSVSQSLMLVSSLPQFDVSDSSATMRDYTMFAKRDSSSDVRANVFISKVKKIHQLLTIGNNLVAFKMIFSLTGHPSKVGFDFIIPKNAYPQFIKTIESVAGSVEFIHSIKPSS